MVTAAATSDRVRKYPWRVLVPALPAAAVSLYLTVTSWSFAARPLGCGAGSGCDEVLSSRWSRVVGLPVGLPAAGLYVLTAMLAIAAVGSRDAKRIGLCSQGLWLMSGAILAAVHWFIGLQWLELRVYCPWCLIDHTLGVWTALAVLVGEVRAGRFRPLWFVGGMALTALLVLLQIVVPGAAPPPAALSRGQLELLAGRLQIDRAEVPQIGALEAPPVVVLFDYCCPHCRQTHAQLLSLLGRAPRSFSILLLPAPLNADCNPHVEETEPRFEAACELARLALAVWRADRARFGEFDRWLFESEQPRAADEARREAERLVGREALSGALKSEWIAARLSAHVDALEASGVEALPVLLSPGHGGVSGRAADETALSLLLREALGITLPIAE